RQGPAGGGQDGVVGGTDGGRRHRGGGHGQRLETQQVVGQRGADRRAEAGGHVEAGGRLVAGLVVCRVPCHRVGAGPVPVGSRRQLRCGREVVVLAVDDVGERGGVGPVDGVQVGGHQADPAAADLLVDQGQVAGPLRRGGAGPSCLCPV